MNPLYDLFKKVSGNDVTGITPVTEAGSNRRYYRITDGIHSFIGVKGEIREENEAFIYLSRHFHNQGFQVPLVRAVSEDSMFYLQEDLEDISLYELILNDKGFPNHTPELTKLLEKCICDLVDFQFKGTEGLDYSFCYPVEAFDARAMMWDLNSFKYYFLRLSGTIFNEKKLEDDFEKFISLCRPESYSTFMYRDFQSRNILIKENTPCYIDFQGGRKGPYLYDLVSFLWQAKARFQEDLQNHLIEVYTEQLNKYIRIEKTALLQSLWIFRLLRLLQVLSAYGYRGYIEHKKHFLESIPAAFEQLTALLKENTMKEIPYLRGILQNMTEIYYNNKYTA